jgi:pimeloyl-ACP methyl ester carboxylesterase
MSILTQMQSFTTKYGKAIPIGGTTWRYYCLGSGSPLLWLTGGLRRSALAFDFLQRLATHHTVIAPDYPPVKTIGEIVDAFDAILESEGIESMAIGAQSYGGMLAQAYLAHRPGVVRRLVLSSTGPADYSCAWLPVESIFIGLARLLPEKTVKNLLASGLLRLITVPEAGRDEWMEAVQAVLQNDLTRQDVVSHFAVAADLIRAQRITPGVFRNWKGRVVVLSSENDITQSRQDFAHYEKLFGRPVESVNMGRMGHTAVLFDPDKYLKMMEAALA